MKQYKIYKNTNSNPTFFNYASYLIKYNNIDRDDYKKHLYEILRINEKRYFWYVSKTSTTITFKVDPPENHDFIDDLELQPFNQGDEFNLIITLISNDDIIKLIDYTPLYDSNSKDLYNFSNFIKYQLE